MSLGESTLVEIREPAAGCGTVFWHVVNVRRDRPSVFLTALICGPNPPARALDVQEFRSVPRPNNNNNNNRTILQYDVGGKKIPSEKFYSRGDRSFLVAPRRASDRSWGMRRAHGRQRLAGLGDAFWQTAVVCGWVVCGKIIKPRSHDYGFDDSSHYTAIIDQHYHHVDKLKITFGLS